MKFIPLVAVISIALITEVFAQTNAGIAQVGYAYPGVFSLAPGQILTLFLNGITPNATKAVAAADTPLPTTLAGISVTLTYVTGPQPYSLPILAVAPPQVSGVGFTLVTVQAPYELPLDTFTRITGDLDLVVSDGTRVSSVKAHSTPDQIHILGDDTIMLSLSLAAGRSLVPSSGHAITHADGRLVTASDPAVVGEEIVIYAVGLGSAGFLKTGQASPTDAPYLNIAVSFDYRTNASPSRAGFRVPTRPDPNLPFIGLSPGLVGVYQANVIVPVRPAAIMECDGDRVQSNLTITLIGHSFDGAGICVKNP